MLIKLLAYATMICAMAAFAICTWADYAVSGSVRHATGD